MGAHRHPLTEGWDLWVADDFVWSIQRSDPATGQALGEEIPIPRDLLIRLVAAELRYRRISRVEEMSDDELLDGA